jgi:hypothetical protein
MTGRRKLEWVLLASTAGLFIFLKWLHLGVIHYNWFLVILLAWCGTLIGLFRLMARADRQKQGQ